VSTTLTPETLADIRKKAEAARLTPSNPVSFVDVAGLYNVLPPTTVLALLDRIEALEGGVRSLLPRSRALDRHAPPDDMDALRNGGDR
jgi:hypothetical protein